MSLLAQLGINAGSIGSTDQLNTVRARLDQLDQRMAQFETLSEPAVAERMAGIARAYAPLRASWTELQAALDAVAVPLPPAASAARDEGRRQVDAVARRTDDLSDSVRGLLGETQAEEERRIEAAAERSFEVERLTNRASTAMFLVTLALALLSPGGSCDA